MTCPYCFTDMDHDYIVGEWRCPFCDYHQWDDFDPATESPIPTVSPL